MTTTDSIDQPQLVAFVNAKSGRFFRDSSALGKVKALCRNRAELQEVSDDLQLAQKLTRLPERKGLQIGILGGDGTVMRVMTQLDKVFGPSRLPLLVPIPFGTMCTTSRRWGAGRTPFRTLDAWLNHEPLVLARQESLSVTIDDCEQLVGCTLGTGLVAQFFERYEALGAHGVVSAGRIAIEGFIGSFVSSEFSQSIMRPLDCRITIEGKEISPKHFSLVVCSVFKDVGLGIKVTYRAGDEPGRIALVTSSLAARQLGPQFWRVFSGRALRDPLGIDRLVCDWSLQFDKSGPIIVDGERRDVNRVRVRPGPTWSVLTERLQ